METLCKTAGGKSAPCSVARLTASDVTVARFSWGGEFQQRHARGIRDDDELIWERGFMLPAGDGGPSGYVVTADNQIQGIVVIDQQLRTSKLQPFAALAYIRYLATAPWNRPCAESPGRFRGIGRLLVVQAVTEGQTLGSRGGIGLHSFVAAHPFYIRLGFKNLGVDPAERGMLYLELLPEAAHRLLTSK